MKSRGERSGRSGQVSGRNHLPVDEVVEGLVEALPGAGDRYPGMDLRWERVEESQTLSKDAVVCLGEEDGEAAAVGVGCTWRSARGPVRRWHHPA